METNIKIDKLEQLFQITSRMCLDHQAEFDEDYVHVDFKNGYVISFDRKTDKFELSKEVVISGGYHAPDDVDIVHIEYWLSPWQAIQKMLLHAKNDEIQNMFESITMDIVWYDTEEI